MTMTLAQKLATKQFVLTAEITPPVSCSRDELLDKVLPLKGVADTVNITDGAGARPHLGAVTSAGILVEKGIEPILQLTCRDRNRIGLQSELMSAAALGVRNLLVLRGDRAPLTASERRILEAFGNQLALLLERDRLLRSATSG